MKNKIALSPKLGSGSLLKWRKKCTRTRIKTDEARALALQVDLARVHVSALPRLWWLIFGQKQGKAGVGLRKKGESGKTSKSGETGESGESGESGETGGRYLARSKARQGRSWKKR